MKKLVTLITGLAITASCQHAVAQSYAELLKDGKRMIREERNKTAYEKSDFSKAIATLEKAARLSPNNAEIHYFLGSAYDYDNSSDAIGIVKSTTAKAFKASKEFETVIRLSPKYKGEIIALDPYAKLSSIWGVLGFHYMQINNHDSAVWAFKEGKKRGAFSDFALNFYRYSLTSVEPNAIVLTFGDFSTMNLWYLQEVEQLRPDVRIVNLSMLSVPWVTSYLYKKDHSLFSSEAKANDTTLYVEWNEKEVSIPISQSGKTFTWTLKPVRMDKYLFREDLLLLDLLTTNQFKRPLYFEKGCLPEDLLDLTDYMKDKVIWDQLGMVSQPKREFEFVADLNKFPYRILKTANVNGEQEVNKVHQLRYETLAGVQYLYNTEEPGEAKKLFNQITTNIPVSMFPYEDKGVKRYMQEYSTKLK